jgi:DNA-binding winged helix-turn-helix (wHTH) protein
MFRGPEEPVRQNRVVRTANVTIDLGGQAALRDRTEVRLSPTEYGLIAALAAQAGQVVGHRTLLRTVWGPGYADERHYLRIFVHRLRAKLETDPKHPEVIVTVGERGYRFGMPAATVYRDPYVRDPGRAPGVLATNTLPSWYLVSNQDDAIPPRSSASWLRGSTPAPYRSTHRTPRWSPIRTHE